MDITARNKNYHKDLLLTMQKKSEKKSYRTVKGVKGSTGDITNNFSVLSLPNGTFKSRKPLINSEKTAFKKILLRKDQEAEAQS